MDKKAVYNFTYGLFVLTVRLNEKHNGCIINTGIQVTTDPNRISITVNKANLTHNMLAYTGEFNISILSEKATFPIFERFGFQSGMNVDKFAGYAYCAEAANGIKYITEGTNAYISAKVVQSIDLGTHTMFIADVTDMKVLDKAPSASYSYYHSNIKPKPKAASDKTAWRCTVCNYVYEGEEIPEDFICPLCKHPASDFEKVV